MEHEQINERDAVDVLTRLADRSRPSRASTTPEYLEDFRAKFERVQEMLETGLTQDLEGRGPSEDLMHDWSLFIAQGQDFLAAIGAEIERAK